MWLAWGGREAPSKAPSVPRSLATLQRELLAAISMERMIYV